MYAANNPIKVIDPLATYTIHINSNGTPQIYPDGLMVSHPDGDGNVFIQDQPLSEIVFEVQIIHLVPNFVGVSLSEPAILGVGFYGEFTFGIIPNEGLFTQFSIGFGGGLDISGSVNFKQGVYKKEGKPTTTSLEGTNRDISVGVSFVNGGYSENRIEIYNSKNIATSY